MVVPATADRLTCLIVKSHTRLTELFGLLHLVVVLVDFIAVEGL